jgi:hypothetical protein
MNKLETSRRSKDCIELHDNPKILTVDAPLEGVYDFSCDMVRHANPPNYLMISVSGCKRRSCYTSRSSSSQFFFSAKQVFDEYATQQEVYQEVVEPIPQKLLDGINCALIAYGQTGTGKSHTMLGEGHGAEINARVRRGRGETTERSGSRDSLRTDSSGASGEQELDLAHISPLQTEGMIPKAVSEMFRLIRSAPPQMEYTIRCSYVEIYLEKVCDLLQPSQQDVRVGHDEDRDACIMGASELCCVDAMDVYSLLARGNAYRTKSATVTNMDSSRSHAVVTLRIDQIDRSSGKQRTSRLQMLDLAGSELGRTKSSRQTDTAVSAEGKMINQSLACLSNMIRATLAQQGTERSAVHPDKFSNSSKLARLLQPCFGGNFFTTLICTASPSSYNIGETINSILFAQRAQKVKNCPKIREEMTLGDYRKRLTTSERRLGGLTTLVQALAKECQASKGENNGSPNNPRIWGIIDKVLQEGGQEEDIDLHVEVTKKGHTPSADKEIADDVRLRFLERQVQEAKLAREKTENCMRDIQSDLVSLRSQNEVLIKERDKTERDLNDAKTEIRVLSTRKVEVEHNLRTSQFRENEATAFLRQFRSFYLRLLKNKAAQGNGDTSQISEEVSKNIPGVPELEDLIDIDKLMMASGLIEDKEVGEDTNSPKYFPSKNALSRSATEAEQAEHREMELMRAMENETNGTRRGRDGDSEMLSIVHRQESAQLAAYRQKLVQSPAGQLAMKKEKELEKELVELSNKSINLQNAVNAEKAMVEALSARQGALSKIKTAQEMNTLRQELERKTNDLQAIVWKMNELHLVNKTVDEKVENREHHVTYLEEHLIDLQTRNRRLVIERQETEKKLREESSYLRQQLDGLNVKLWQLGEPSEDKTPPWRLIVPFSAGEEVDERPIGKLVRRLSLGDLDEEMEVSDIPTLATASTQTDPVEPDESTKSEALTQTDEESKSDTEAQTDESSRLHSLAVEMGTQTEEEEKPVGAVEMETQTEEEVKIEVIEISTQTEVLEEVKSMLDCTEISTQTDTELAFDAAVQTDKGDEAEAKSVPSSAEISTQTDDAYEEQKSKVEAAEIAIQTDLEHTKLCFETGTKTDELPKEIALGTSRSIDTGSYDESEQQLLSESKQDASHPKKSNSQETLSEGDLSASMSSIGERWKPLKPLSSCDRDAPKQDQFSRSSSVDDGDSSLEASASSLSSAKEKIQKRPGVSNPEERLGGSLKWNSANADERLGSSVSGRMNTSFSSGPTYQASGASPSKWKKPKGKTKTNDAGSEWKSRLKEMGIKTGEEDAVLSASRVLPPPIPAKTPEWMSKLKESGPKGDENDGEAEAPTSASHLPQARYSFDVKSKVAASTHLAASASVGPNAPPPQAGTDATPEWMQKLKNSSQKIEPPSNPAPKPPVTPIPTVKAHITPPKSDDATPKLMSPSQTPAGGDGGPEWMQKFRQISQKGAEEIVSPKRGSSDMLQGGKPADYEPRRFVDTFGLTVTSGVTHEDDVELERIRKEEKKARKIKKKKKALKKAKEGKI